MPHVVNPSSMVNNKKNSGFTYIELLIVVTIIAVLFTIVFVSIRSIQKKTQNTRVRNDVRQLRLLAEQVFDSAGANFINWSTNPLIVNNVQTLRSDIATVNRDTSQQLSSSVIIDNRTEEYCISAQLLQPENGFTHFCVDASAVFKLSHSHCVASVDTAVPLVCPN